MMGSYKFGLRFNCLLVLISKDHLFKPLALQSRGLLKLLGHLCDCKNGGFEKNAKHETHDKIAGTGNGTELNQEQSMGECA